jgi:lysophospholipase L1-like esterase
MVKLVIYNIRNFIVLWIAILVLIAIGNDVWRFTLKPALRADDPRASLPVYDDHAYAERVYRNQKVADFDYVPFIEWRHKPYSSETLNIDGNGYRMNGNPAAQFADRANTVTVGFFGGSTIWGTGVDDKNTIPALFGNLNSRFRVMNFGERGFDSRQNLNELINLTITQAAPQVVIFYGGYNDVWVHCNYAVSKLLNGHVREQRLRQALLVSEDTQSAVYHYLIEPVYLVLSRVSGSRGFLPACSNDPQRAAAVAAMIVENWQIAHELVSRHGGKFFAFLQPNAHVGSPNLSYLNMSENRMLRSEEYRAVYPLVRKFAAQKSAKWIIDLSTVLDGDRLLYVDDAHLSPEGNKTIAKKIYETLRTELASAESRL